MNATQGRPTPKVSIVIPAFNRWAYTRRCLTSLAEHTRDVPHEIVVVDNASSDETRTALPAVEGIRVHRNERNLGFARACNQGAALAGAPYLLFLNNDTEALPGWLPPMVRILDARPQVVAVGAKLLFPDGTLQHAGVAFAYAEPLPVSPFHMHYQKPASASARELELNCVTAACMLVRADAFREVRGFDEGYRNGYEDVDLCLQLRSRGHRIVYTPESVLYHHESVSEGRFLATRANEDRLQRRWMDLFNGFEVDRRDEDVRLPPRPGRPPLSVVVHTKESLSVILPCLEDLALAIGPGDEIVVSDATSHDCTLEIVKAFAAAHPGLVTIVRGAPDLEAALRAGHAAATRDVRVQLPPVRVQARLLNDLTTLLSRPPAPALVALPAREQGFCGVGRRAAFERLVAADPGALLDDDPARLARAVEGLRAGRLHLVPPQRAAA